MGAVARTNEENAHISDSYELRDNNAWEFKFNDRIYSSTAFCTKWSQKCRRVIPMLHLKREF